MLQTPTIVMPNVRQFLGKSAPMPDEDVIEEYTAWHQRQFESIEHFSTGILLSPGLWNLNRYINESFDEYDSGFSRRYVKKYAHVFPNSNMTVQWGDWPNYGVADSPTQFLERYGRRLNRSRHKLFVIMHPVYKDQQPADGGWRWHKWGTYVGRGKPEHEYLYDETGFDTVWCYHIHRFNNQVST